VLFSTTVSQSVQLGWPGWSANLPFSQSVHVEAAIPLMEPGRQGAQALLSVLLWVPAAQGLQKPSPEELTKPGWQLSQPPRSDAPSPENLPAGHSTSSRMTLSQYLPDGVDVQEGEPGSLRLPLSHAVQVSVAPVEKVLVGHVSMPDLSGFTLVPAPFVEQKAAPEEEKLPGSRQSSQSDSEVAPLSLNFPAGQGTSAVPLQKWPEGVVSQEDEPGSLWPPSQTVLDQSRSRTACATSESTTLS
jgi:hypothetical protein